MTANGEVQTREEPRYMSKNWTYSWQLCFSKIHRPFFRLGSSAKITGIPTIGPVVRNHNSSKMADEWNATRRTTYRSLSLVCQRVPPRHLHLLRQHLHRRILWSARKIQQQKKWSYEWGVTENPSHKNEDDEELRSEPLQDLPEWLQGESGGSILSQLFLWITNGAASKIGIGSAQCFCSLPEGPKLRHLTHWYSRAKSRKFWWRNNSRSQSSLWRMWISTTL